MVAWTTGHLDYRLRPLQKEASKGWEASKALKNREFYLEATRRFGKSFWMLSQLNKICIQEPKARCMFFAPVRQGLMDYVMPLITELFDDCPDGLKPFFHVQQFKLTYKNGSSLIFRGANMKQHRFRRGNNIRAAAIDELRDVDDLENLIESVIKPSLFSSNGYLLMGSTPADSMEHPAYSYRQLAIKEGWFYRATIWDAGDKDPQNFPPERIEEFRRKARNEIAWKQEYECEWVRDPNSAIVPGWDQKTMIVPPDFIAGIKKDKDFKHFRYFEAVDFGVKDFTVCLVGFYNYKDATLYIERELIMNGKDLTTRAFGASLLRIEEELGISERVYLRVSDNDPGSQLLALDLMDSHGMAFYQTDKDRLHAMVNKLNIFVDGNRVRVSSECPFTTGSLQNCQWDDDRKQFKRSVIYGHADAVAALIYMVRNLVESNPIPGYRPVIEGTAGFENPWAPKPVDKNTEALKRALGLNRLRFNQRDQFN
jgi:hypothetical protein